MNPDDINKIAELVAAKISATGAGDGDGAAKKPEPTKSVEEIVSEILEKKNKAPDPDFQKKLADQQDEEGKKLSQQKTQEASVKFNLGFDTLMSEQAGIFGGKDIAETTKKLISESVKNETLETKKASIRAKNLLSVFTTKYPEKDALPDQIKSRISEWESLSNDEKDSKALKYFDDIIGLTISVNKARAKTKEMNIVDGLGNQQTSKIQEKIKEMRKDLEYK